MWKLVYFTKGSAFAYDKGGKKESVERAWMYVPKDCEEVPCECEGNPPCSPPTPVVP